MVVGGGAADGGAGGEDAGVLWGGERVRLGWDRGGRAGRRTAQEGMPAATLAHWLWALATAARLAAERMEVSFMVGG